MNGPETYVPTNSQTLFLPQPLLDALALTCYYDIGSWGAIIPQGEIAPVAQWIEHAPSKRVAVGSSPAGRALYLIISSPPNAFLLVIQGWLNP